MLVSTSIDINNIWIIQRYITLDGIIQFNYARWRKSFIVHAIIMKIWPKISDFTRKLDCFVAAYWRMQQFLTDFFYIYRHKMNYLKYSLGWKTEISIYSVASSIGKLLKNSTSRNIKAEIRISLSLSFVEFEIGCIRRKIKLWNLSFLLFFVRSCWSIFSPILVFLKIGNIYL